MVDNLNYFMISLHEINVVGLGLELTTPRTADRPIADCITESGVLGFNTPLTTTSTCRSRRRADGISVYPKD